MFLERGRDGEQTCWGSEAERLWQVSTRLRADGRTNSDEDAASDSSGREEKRKELRRRVRSKCVHQVLGFAMIFCKLNEI